MKILMVKHYADEFINTLSDGLNLIVKQKFNNVDDITDLKSDDLEGFKALNETFNSYCALVTEQAKETEFMVRQLEDIQDQLKNINLKLERIEQA